MSDLTFCRKCGASVYGVTYEVGQRGGECLRRLCRCGYTWTEPTKDADAEKQSDPLVRLVMS